MDYFDVVFDGPVQGRFVEVENPQRHSITVGEWIHRDDGYWVLRIPRMSPSVPPDAPPGYRHELVKIEAERTPDGVDPRSAPCAGTRGAHDEVSVGAHPAAVARSSWIGPMWARDAAHAELLAIHEAVMNPQAIVINESDTFTVKLVKQFIQLSQEWRKEAERSNAENEQLRRDLAEATAVLKRVGT